MQQSAQRSEPTAEDYAFSRLICFAAYQWPGYRDAPHHRLIARKLEAVERGEISRLMISMPPRHGKSMLASEFFPAWYMGRNPDHSVVTATYAQDLADDFGRKVKNQLEDPAFCGIFPGVRLADDSKSVKRFHVEQGGQKVEGGFEHLTQQRGAFYAVGVGGPLTGRGAHLLLIDDPVKNREDADSEILRKKIKDWYTSTAYTRLMPQGRIVVIQTRWHEDDLAGWLISDHAHEGWDVLSLPALSSRNEALWPEQYDVAALERIKRTLPTRDWSALYQQEPTPDTGDYFKREWLIPVEVVPPRESLRLYGGSDYAVSSGRGDYTVHGVLGLDSDGNPWLVDLWRRQASSEEWVAALCDLVLKWKPMGWAEEMGQIKSGVGPFLEREMNARKAYCAREQFPTRGDKAVRAQSFRGLIATRGLRIPARAEWRGDFENELLRFPAGVHDDQVDACVAEQTMILMADGSEVAVENVCVGDYVATPLGSCEVLAAKETNRAAKVYCITVESGRTLVATSNHPIFCDGSGFVRVDALRFGDKIVMEPPCAKVRALPKSLSIVGIDIGGIRKVETRHISDISTPQSQGADFCTGTSGKMSAGQFLLASKFTTEMETGLITRLVTLPALLGKSIGNATFWSARLTSSSFCILRASGAKPPNGTRRLPELLGIANTARAVGLAVKRAKRYAFLAVRVFLPFGPSPVFVRVGASNAVLGAGRQSAADSSLKVRPSPANVAIGSSSPNGQKSHFTVLKHVECVIAIRELSAPARVLNLTVDRASAYYANGFLTHNCGLIGQLLDTMMSAPKPKKQIDEKRDGYSSSKTPSRDDEWMTL